MRQGKQGKNVVRTQVRRALDEYQAEELMDKLEMESYVLHQARHRGTKNVVDYTPTPRTHDKEVG